MSASAIPPLGLGTEFTASNWGDGAGHQPPPPYPLGAWKGGKWKPEPTLANARSYALWLLAKGMQTSEILRDKLLQKGYSKKDAATVIQQMTEMKYLDDVNYADVYFRNLLEFKNYGYFGIKLRLMRKKLPTEEVQRVMDEFSEKKELEIAKKFVSEQEKSSSRSTPEKLLRMLQNRGFRWPAISQALKRGQAPGFLE